MKISCLVERFCEHASYIKNYTSDTTRRYKSNIQLFCKLAGVEDISRITPRMVHQFFLDGRQKRKWSPNTFVTYLKTLKVFFRWCVKENCLQQNPADGVEEPALEQKLPMKLTQQEALRLLEYVANYPWNNPFLRARNHAILATFIFAGLRKRELLNLKNDQVDLEGLTITIRKGKGGKDRLVPICWQLAEILKRYHAERLRLRKTCPEFFVSLTQNMGFSEGGLKHLLERVEYVSGTDFSAHKLRHTFATLMLEGGCDIYSLSKMMGHSDIKTTTIYLSATAEHLRAQMMKHPLNEPALVRSV